MTMRPSPRAAALSMAPEITPQLEATARAHPGGQVTVVDPEFDPRGGVPGWGIRGYFPVSDGGVVDAQGWVANPGYRPGPLTLGFPLPRNWLERHLQLAAAGHEPPTALVTALVAADVVIPTPAEHPDHIPVVIDDEGRSTVVLFTRAELVPAGTPVVRVPVAVLAPIVAGVTITINPGSLPSAEIPGDDLLTALATAMPSSLWPST
jgi:hypothetical protein